MMAIKRHFLILLFVVFPIISSATTMKEALDNVAKYFTRTSVRIQPSQKMVINVVNYHSKIKDQTAKLIETELYFALEKKFPKFKLILQSEAVAGIASENAVFVKGSYELRGGTTIVRFQAVKGLFGGEILAQVNKAYKTEKIRKKTLVAVLDIEAKTIGHEQRKILSDVFRTAFGEIGAFDMASSAEIDKMDADQIQVASGCSRDTCATIIGEQLGVDRVISSSLRRMDTDYYFLSGKMMDIKDGSIIATKTIKHSGNIRTLDEAFKKLAYEIVYYKGEEVPVKIKPEASSNWGWQVFAISLALGSAYQSSAEASDYNDLAKENESIREQYLAASTGSLKDKLISKYKANQEEMDKSEQNILIYDAVTALAVVWEIYLLWPSDESDSYSIDSSNSWIPRYSLKTNQEKITSSLVWEIKF
jgi:hypothetical protein